MRGFPCDERGSVAVMSGLLGLVGCLLAAIAVDVGSIALNARRLQGAADLAAMAAASKLADAQDAADRTTAGNSPVGDITTEVALGRYTPDPLLAPARRFAPGGAEPNAVRVTLRRTAPIYFGALILGKSSVPLQRSATAAMEPPRAVFSIGSRLARLDGGLANQMLSALTGSTVSLSALDYQALASSRVNLLEFSDALAADIGVPAGDYDALLKRDIDAGRALKVIENLSGSQADAALSKLSAGALGVDLPMRQLIGVDAGAPEGLRGALDVSVSALDLASAMLEIGGGDRQLALALDVPAGIAEMKTSLAIGERPNKSPWLAVTREGEPIIRTAQARLYVRVRTAQKLSGLAQVNLPILIEVASAEARLNAIECDPARAVTIDVRPGVAAASIGVIDERDLDDFTRPTAPQPATVLSVLGLVSLSASGRIEAADVGFTPVRSSDTDIKTQQAKTVRTTGMVNGVIVSLLREMKVEVHAVGLGLGLGGIVSALGGLLTPLGPLLDAAINPVLSTLGLGFGEADVRVHDARCDSGAPILVG